jgi:hypothetical protein
MQTMSFDATYEHIYFASGHLSFICLFALDIYVRLA